jgi:RHS repeat-associated protein
MMMPGRKYEAGTGYRYGFNGKENDNEVKGEGNQQDYSMRIYDPRLGRFLSVDPLMKKYPFYSPYHYAGNSPIKNIDLDGAEPAGNRWDWKILQIGSIYTAEHKLNNGQTVIALAEQQYVEDQTGYKSWITHMSWTETEGTYGISQRANAFYWYNEDIKLNYPKKDVRRWGTFETDQLRAQRQMGELADATAIAVFKAALYAPTFFAGGGTVLAVQAQRWFARAMIEGGGQLVVNGGDWKKTDVADIGFGSLLSPAGTAFFGASIDWRPFANRDKIQVVGVNKNINTALIDFGFKYAFGGNGLQGSISNSLIRNYGGTLKTVEENIIKNCIQTNVSVPAKILNKMVKEKTTK